MKIKDVFEKSVQFFKEKNFDTPRLDAELLIAHTLKIDRVQIYVKYEQPLKESEISACREAVRRRSSGEPVAYIIEEKGFFREVFSVGPGVLIPRPETEMIVEHALQFIEEKNLQKPRILDLGAGSGCIGLALLKNSPNATLLSLEKSPAAFKYLEKNTEKLNLTSRAQIELADAETFDFSQSGVFDLIVSNPPYIEISDPQVEANVKKFEPHQALYAADKGLYFIKSWITKAAPVLSSPGLLLFEMGSSQKNSVEDFLKDKKLFFDVQIIKDLSGLDRIIKIIR